MTAYLAVPLKDRNGRHKGWFVYALPLGNMSRCYGHYRGCSRSSAPGPARGTLPGMRERARQFAARPGPREEPHAGETAMTRCKGIPAGPVILGIVAGVTAGVEARNWLTAVILGPALAVLLSALLWLLSVLVTSSGRRRGGSR